MAQELEDLAGNSMNIRAAAVGWIALFTAVDLHSWNRHATTTEDTEPLVEDVAPWDSERSEQENMLQENATSYQPEFSPESLGIIDQNQFMQWLQVFDLVDSLTAG